MQRTIRSTGVSPMQCLDGDAIARNTQFAHLHQQQSEVAGKIDVAEEVAVTRSRGQQGDCGIDAICAARQRDLQLLEERCQPQRLAGGKDVAGHVGVHHAVGKCIADARGRLGMGISIRQRPSGPRARSVAKNWR